MEDCSICLDAMHPYDNDHPLQCHHRCGYNFCKNCIASLIASSKDDFMEASDGNLHVKVYLHCPNCRSDLSATIRDTLLLRKVDAHNASKKGCCDTEQNDEESASQLLTEQILTTPEVKAAIARARISEAQFLGRSVPELEAVSMEDDDDCDDYDEEGIEMDLVHGVHQSFRLRRTQPKQHKRQPTVVVQTDSTLFGGLDYFLNDEEQLYVTQLLTSGDAKKLGEAAQILHSVAELHKNPRETATASKYNQKFNNGNIIKKKRPSFVKKSSILDLVQEAKEVHDRHQDADSENTEQDALMNEELLPTRRPRPRSLAQHKASQHRQLELDLKRQATFSIEFPIPVRMPKCIEINLEEPLDWQLMDDSWNGTVMDAYSKISIGYANTVTITKRSNHAGVRRILGGSDVQIELPGLNRILISHAGRLAGRQGAIQGDVVTHIDGEALNESCGIETSAAKLWMKMNAAKQRGSSSIHIYLNAERSVAEALKRRATAIRECSW